MKMTRQRWIYVFWLFSGGFFGALVRSVADHFLAGHHLWAIPVSTFTVNIIGAAFLGVLLSSTFSASARLFFSTGFCGSLTTYSAVMVAMVHANWADRAAGMALLLLSGFSVALASYYFGKWANAFPARWLRGEVA